MGHEGEHGHGEHAHPDDDDHDHDHVDVHESAHDSVRVKEDGKGSFFPPSSLTGCARVLHVDPVAGAAGDMLIAALLDLGVPEAVVRDAVGTTELHGYELAIGRREKHAIAARAFDVIVHGSQPPRDYATIDAMLARATLDERVRVLARHVFLRLGEAEAKIHRQPLARVHFHEVGGVDAIVDVVGACAGLAWLEAQAGGVGLLGITLSPIPFGGGRARGAHGSIPVPAPAALELLIGLPTRDAALPDGQQVELITPTGAALLRAWTELLPSRLDGAWPKMTPRAIGYGAGRRELSDRPNVVRLVLGDVLAEPQSERAATHAVLACNVDDATGEVAGAAIEALLAEGALDAWAMPITMKKGRPALTLSVLVPVAQAEAMARTLLAHTGSLGVRRSDVSRVERPRRFVEVETAYGVVRVKVADGDGLPVVVHPELEDCRARAAEHVVPVREVIRAAIAAFRE